MMGLVMTKFHLFHEFKYNNSSYCCIIHECSSVYLPLRSLVNGAVQSDWSSFCARAHIKCHIKLATMRT